MLGVPVTAVDVLYVSIPPLSATTLVSFWAYTTVDQCQIKSFCGHRFFKRSVSLSGKVAVRFLFIFSYFLQSILYWLAVRRSVVHRCSNLSRKLNGFDYLIAKPSPLQDVPFGRHHAAACFVFKSLVCILSRVCSRTSSSAFSRSWQRRQLNIVTLLHVLLWSLVCILSLVRSRTSPSPQLAAATQTAERRRAAAAPVVFGASSAF